MSANPEGLVAEARHFAICYAYPQAKEHILALIDRLEAAAEEAIELREIVAASERLRVASERQREALRGEVHDWAIEAIYEAENYPEMTVDLLVHRIRSIEEHVRPLSSPEGATKGEG